MGQALAISIIRFSCSAVRLPSQVTVQEKVLLPEGMSAPFTRFTVTLNAVIAQPFRCTYMRSVMAVHEARDMHSRSPGAGPSSCPFTERGSSDTRECRPLCRLVVYVSPLFTAVAVAMIVDTVSRFVTAHMPEKTGPARTAVLFFCPTICVVTFGFSRNVCPMPVDLCCIGHITLDHVVTPASSVFMPGGTAFYFSRALAGMPLRYMLVTAVGKPEMPVVEALRAKGIEVIAMPSEHSVFFENRYGENPDQRTQNVWQKAAPFAAEALAGLEAGIFHLGPLLADDFSQESIKVLAAKGKLSLDVQGLLRGVKEQRVVAADWPEKRDVLPLLHFLKASEEEMQVLTGTADVQQGAKRLAGWGAKEVIITLGSRGSVVYDGRQFYTIPAYPPLRVQDATGCGDTYMAGYLYRRSKGAGPQQAGEFAAAMATLKIGVSGPFTGKEEDVKAVLAKDSGGF